MAMIQGELGGPGLIFPPVVTLRETVDLGQPFTDFCKPLLRGFELGNFPDDYELRHVRVNLETRLLDDFRNVEVIAEIELRDSHAGGDGDWRALEIRVYYTLIAE